jgi:hypothetical protein
MLIRLLAEKHLKTFLTNFKGWRITIALLIASKVLFRQPADRDDSKKITYSSASPHISR